MSLVAATAASGLIGFPLLFSIGIHLTSAAHGALVLAVLPLFTGFFAAVVERTVPPGRWWLGCTVALAGEVILMTSRTDLESGGASLIGDGLVIGAALFASLSYVAGARLEQAGYSSWGTTFWGALGAGILLSPVLFLLPDQSWMAAGASTWASILYLAAGSTILAYVAWYWALGKGGIGRVGIIQFLQPVVGVALAVILLGDPVTLPLATGAVAILGGVFIAQRR